MGNAAVTTAGPPRGTPFDPSQDEAGGSISLFGVTPARALKIPLKHWILSLVLLALSGVAGYLYGEYRSTEKFNLVGRLVVQPPPPQKDIPLPKDLDTLKDEMKKDEYFAKLNEKFGLSIPPELWARLFDVKKPDSDAKIILVNLTWEDREQGKALVKEFMQLHLDAATDERKKDLIGARKSTKDSLASCEVRVSRARKDEQDLLDLKGFKGLDPKEKLTGLELAIKDLEKESRLVRASHNAHIIDKGKLMEEIEKLEILQRQIPTQSPGKEAIDPDFEEKRDTLKTAIRKAQQELDKARLELTQSEGDFTVKEGLYKKLVVTKPQLEQAQSRFRNAKSAVAGLEKDMEEFQAKLNKLRPTSLRLQEAKKELKTVKRLIENERGNLELNEQRLADTRKEQQQAEDIKRAWDPKHKEVEILEKERLELRQKESELDQQLGNVAGELRINSDVMSSFPLSDRKKQSIIGFGIALVLGLGLMIGRELTTKTLRAEVMADRLRLPILAESDSGSSEQASGLSSNQSRALSLRIRQYVPGEGAAVLISSLNERNTIDPLVTDLARYFAMRNEHVLILDARIAQAQARVLAGLIERRVDGEAPEVVPWVANGPGAAGPGVAGLVQYLVFEGQSYTTFTYQNSRLPGVDYMPAGGPYPVTDALASEPMDDLLKTLRKVYTLILVVGPAVTRDVDTEILAAYVDGMVLVLNNPLGTFSPTVEHFMRSLKQKHAPLLGSVICV
jgi:Mrp family chromosome partitioning ATPase